MDTLPHAKPPFFPLHPFQRRPQTLAKHPENQPIVLHCPTLLSSITQLLALITLLRSASGPPRTDPRASNRHRVTHVMITSPNQPLILRRLSQTKKPSNLFFSPTISSSCRARSVRLCSVFIRPAPLSRFVSFCPVQYAYHFFSLSSLF